MFLKIFRLVFVVFSLYLTGDAFYRWDGFKHYGTFFEFLPTVALITVLWSIVSLFVSLIIWLLTKAVEWLCLRWGLKYKAEYSLIFIGISLLAAVAAWKGKQVLLSNMPATFQVKLLILLFIVIVSTLITWILRNKGTRLIEAVQERIIPLVWLFGILFLISVPVSCHYAINKNPDNAELKKNVRYSSTAKDKNYPNIILVTFDALTARNMSVYGYHRQTTPFIEKWAKQASLFTKAHADCNWTSPSVASLMTGKRVWSHLVYNEYEKKIIKGETENLPLLLKNKGYYTMSFITSSHASPKILGIAKGFNINFDISPKSFPLKLIADARKLLGKLYDGKIKLYDWITREDFIFHVLLRQISGDVSETEFPPEAAFNEFLEFIDNNTVEPFFVWIHILPPHDPYLPPEAFKGIFNPSSYMRTLKSQMKILSGLMYRNFSDENQKTVEILRSRYDEFIQYCDRQFEDFIGQLRERNILDNSVVILSADHGESFDDNYLGHGGYSLYEQLTHIPLIIKEPNQSIGRTIVDVVAQIDIAPTILDFAQTSKPSWMEGQSLLPYIYGNGHRTEAVLSMTLDGNLGQGNKITVGTIAVWNNNYKLIHNIGKESQLFNLKDDPDEENNILDKEPAVSQQFLKIIKENLKKANERIAQMQLKILTD